MKQFKKTLILCAIMVLVIAAVFTLSACKKAVVESISVEITGGGQKVELTEQNATKEAIAQKIKVVANLSDKTTQPVTEFTIEGFDSSKVGQTQTVTVKYGEFTKPLSVEIKATPVVEPQIVSIAVTFEGTKITLQQATASEAAVLAQITVTATYDDQSTKPLTEGVTLVGFTATTLDTDQTVKAKVGTIESNEFTVVVESTPVVEPQIVSIAVTFEGTKITLQQATASEAAILAQITVTATYDDQSTKPLTEDVTLVGFTATTLDTDQTVKAKVGTIESNEFTVVVESTPVVEPEIVSIAVTIKDGGEKVTLQQGASSAAALLAKITVTATLDNGETKPVTTGLEFKGFSPATLNTDQTVKVIVGEIESNEFIVVVESTPVVEPQIVSIAVAIKDGAEKVTLQQATASAEAVLAKITVTATLDNSTTKPLTEGVTLEGFNPATLDTDQTVKAKVGTIESNEFTVVVESTPVVEPQIVSIAVTIKDGGEKVTLQQANATEAAILAQIIVTATLDDDNTKPLTTGLTIEGFDPDTLDENQTVKVKVGTIESNGFTVVVESTPDEVLIKINDAAATAMTVDPENENKYLSGDVTLAHGNVVVITLNGTPVAFDGGAESFTATYIGVHTFTVTVGDDGATIAVTEPATSYAITLKVGDDAKETPEAVSGAYTWTLTLNRGDIVTLTDNMFGNIKIAGSVRYTATRSGEYTIKATPGATATTVAVTQPALVVTLTVTRGEEIVTTLTESTADGEGQYVFSGVELKADDIVAITNNAGANYTYDSYSASEWNKTSSAANADGKYTFYVKATNVVYVKYTAPVDTTKKVTIVVNEEDPVELTLDEEKNEYSITLTLNEGDTVKILVNGEEIDPNYENSFNGTANATGSYEFYVKESSTWVTMPANAIKKPVKVYFYNHGWTDNWETVNAYCWTDATESSPKKENAGWPGEKMEDIGGGWFAIDLEEGFENIIFKGGNQTGDLKLEVVDGVAYYDPFGVYTGTERPDVD